MENVNERYIPLNVRTYREGWLKLQGWICVSLLAFLTGGLLVLYEVRHITRSLPYACRYGVLQLDASLQRNSTYKSLITRMLHSTVQHGEWV